ncbi:MAG TPA: Verru_Chthon cassette protein B [Candidatus Saccharimonadia bacterium]|nr:Verru_Chthon cassette protein B [Candidatus Saccharimonadia bacterium]
MHLNLNRLKSRLLQGFSLPEVTISIGIAALGLTSALGFLPQSMQTLKKASDIATETRITQQILSSISNAEWVDAAGKDVLTSEYKGKRYYFDDLAVELDAKEPGDWVSYVAEVEVPEADVSLPSTGKQTGADSDPYLRRVVVKVGNITSTNFDFDAAPPAAYRTYASVVSRSGK